MLKTLTTAAMLAAFAVSGASATVFDAIFVESDGNRPLSMGDIPAAGSVDIGAIAPGSVIGLGGRIVTSTDMWDFSTSTKVTVTLTDLMLGDGNSGFDSSNNGAAPNGVSTATFSLIDAMTMMTVASAQITSSVAPPGFMLMAGPGDYHLLIDGTPATNGVTNPGSTYDLAVATAIPVPAALPLLVGGLGMLVALRRRA
jgi:hypothetical protein